MAASAGGPWAWICTTTFPQEEAVTLGMERPRGAWIDSRSTSLRQPTRPASARAMSCFASAGSMSSISTT